MTVATTASDQRVRRPIEILTALGLCRKESGAAKVTPRLLGEFERRERAFDWVHMGNSELTIGDLVSCLRETPRLCAPRSGHLGNWRDIALGRAGTLDYNQVVCSQWRLGYALVYDFNQTEDATLLQGDWVYLPGSVVDRGQRTLLQLFTWDGARMAPRTRDQPLFTPYVMTPAGGSLAPLSLLHRQGMAQWPQFRFRCWSDLLHRRAPLVRRMLLQLVEHARLADDPEHALGLIFDRAVSLDGVVRRGAVRPEAGGFRAGSLFCASAQELVEAAMGPILAAAEPQTFFAHAGELPWDAPLTSNLVMEALGAVLDAHYPAAAEAPDEGGDEIDRRTMKWPCNPHVHWGAIGMAGYPPRRRGYFASQVRSARKIYQVLIDRLDEIDPVFFVLLPTAPFMLLPASAHPGDAELLADLLCRVHAQTHGKLRSHLLLAEIEQIAAEWLAKAHRHLSRYFLHRFSSRRSVYNAIDLPERSEPLEPRGFRALTLRQASIVVGALKTSIAALGLDGMDDTCGGDRS